MAESSSAKAPYPFPAYATLPHGAAYSGAPADYGASHIQSLTSANAAQAPDKGLTVFSPETLSDGGLLRVARDRITPGKIAEPTEDAASKGARPPSKTEKGFQIWYEVHGRGPQKVVLIMGLNNSGFGWLGQVDRFARDPRYSVLVLDNRGYGNSETPTEMNRYKTSEMAKDALEICDHLGWKEDRQLHITGVSMGGMISLEVARQAPKRVASLSLISTTSGQARGQKSFTTGLPPLAAVKMITRLLGGKWLGLDSDEYRVHRVAETLFPDSWMRAKDDRDPQGRTHRETIRELFEWRFHFVRRQHPTGSLGQIRAASSHHVPNATLQAIDSDVPATLIVTGDYDNLVNPGNSRHLKKWMPSARLEVLKDRGHAIQLQDTDLLNDLLETNWTHGWRRSHPEDAGEEAEGKADAGGEELPASKLGTKQYWDGVYDREVTNYDEEGDRGEIWFGKESADVMIEYLTDRYPDVKASSSGTSPRILDMGTGNGHLLFRLCGVKDDEDDYSDEDDENGDAAASASKKRIASPQSMMGVDYSPASIDLCRRIAVGVAQEQGISDAEEVQWRQIDVLDKAQVQRELLSERNQDGSSGWDIILDKGTLDAIALAEGEDKATTPLATYIHHLALLLRSSPATAPPEQSMTPLLLVTSCNFTAEELVARVTSASRGALAHLETLPPRKPLFTFGGKQGGTTCCVAFTSAKKTSM